VRHIESDSLVLHAFDYRETSRIVRLATRDAGVLSVIARGARRAKSPFGSAIDLFTSGVAHVRLSPGRDLHTLAGFDATRKRSALAGSIARFTAASAIAELCLRFAQEDDSGRVHDAAVAVLDAIGAGAAEQVPAIALAGAWRVVAELGFAPSLDQCASCHAELAPGEAATFDHRAGGALCARCARRGIRGRHLPGDARETLRRWLSGEDAEVAESGARRSHQRLLREFLEEHLNDGRPLRAFLAWERHGAEQREGGMPAADEPAAQGSR
jgi:DNA repair protein RecO (recombination protein O)